MTFLELCQMLARESGTIDGVPSGVLVFQNGATTFVASVLMIVPIRTEV